MQAGKLLKAKGYTFDVAFTSVLKRCILSLHTVLEEAEQLWIPENKCWRLNERHYGDLQDQVKSEVAETVGEKQAKDWRRSYACQPPGVCPQLQNPVMYSKANSPQSRGMITEKLNHSM